MSTFLLKHFWRNAKVDRATWWINVVGLAVGLGSVLVVGLYIEYELRYDRHFPHLDRLYRLSVEASKPEDGEHQRIAGLPAPAMAAVLAEGRGIELAARVFPVNGTSRVRVGQTQANELGVATVDPSFLPLAGVTFLAGDRETALDRPDSAVLTRSLAEKWFPDGNALGRVMNVYRAGDVTVRAVIEDFPANSHLPLRMLLSTRNLPDDFFQLRFWCCNNFHTYVRLLTGADLASFRQSLDRAVERHAPEETQRQLRIVPFPVRDIHLFSDFQRELQPQGHAVSVFIFSSVAVIVLLIACLNFVNLATARAARRAKEIGLKRALGVHRQRLCGEILLEAVLASLSAAALAALAAPLLLPTVSQVAGVELSLALLVRPGWILSLISLAVATGLMAGLYPALMLSGLAPVQALRGSIARGPSGMVLRNTLVVAQFAISVVLLVVTLVCRSQMHYASTMDLGFRTEHTVVLRNVDDAEIDYALFKQRLLTNPYIVSVTAASRMPDGRWPDPDSSLTRPGQPDKTWMMSRLDVDTDFLDAFGVELLAGRMLSDQRSTDSLTRPSAENPQGHGSFLVSRAGAAALDFSPTEAIGELIEQRYSRQGQRVRGPIIGVFEDLHFASIYQPILPIFLQLNPANFNTIAIRIAPQGRRATLGFIDHAWEQMSPEMPILRSFLDDTFEALYQRQNQQIILFERFGLLAIFVACLGLFGLASYSTERRTREIGVRRVFGASTIDILYLLNRSFLRLVLLGAALATPIAYFLADRWLQEFAFRVDLNPSAWLIGIGLATATALATVSVRVYRAAAARPITALRAE